MDISEILKNAGVEDNAIIEKVAAEMPKAYIPLEDFNKRVGKAKGETDAANKQLEELKKQLEDAQNANAGADDEKQKAIDELMKQVEGLKAENQAAKDAERKRSTTDALKKALKDAGANPAAITLLASAALGSVEYGDDGAPSNLDDAIKAVKSDNAELFGTVSDEGHNGGKANEQNGGTDAFLEGFGDTKRR